MSISSASAQPVPPPLRRPPSDADRDLSRGLKWSLVAHAALFAAIVVKSIVFPGKPALYLPTLRVDVVGLPDILKKDLAHLPKAPGGEDDKIAEALKKAQEASKEAELSKPEPAKPDEAKDADQADPDELVLKRKAEEKKAKERERVKREEELEKQKNKDREQKLKNALARIRSLDKIRDSAQAENSGLKNGSTGATGVVIKGNKVSRGTSLSGDAVESSEASYFDQIRDKLQQNWALAPWLARQNLSAQILVFIDSYGRLRSYKFVRPSGNPQFDEAVRKALQDSQPFAAPPEKLVPTLISHGIVIGFPL